MSRTAPRVLPWLLVFLYVPFLFNYGAKLERLTYVDFPTFYFGARLAFAKHHSPYDLAAMTDAGQEVHKQVYPFLYPPPGLLFFYPLSKLGYHSAQIAWLALNHVCILLILYVLLVQIFGFSMRAVFTESLPLFLAAYFLYSRGVETTLDCGQVNLVILLLLCLTWRALKTGGSDWAAALPLAVASVCKIYPALLIVLLLIRRKYRAAGLTVATLAAIAAFSFLVLPHQYWTQWLTEVAPTCGYFRSPQGSFPPTLAANMGIAGFFARLCLPLRLEMGRSSVVTAALWAHPVAGRLITIAMVGLVVAATAGGCLIGSRRLGTVQRLGRPRNLDLEIAAFLLAIFMIAPLAWEHHLVYAIPAVMVAIMNLASPAKKQNALAAGAIMLAACIIAWPLKASPLPLPRMALLVVASTKLYAIAGLWLAVLWQLARRDVSKYFALRFRRSRAEIALPHFSGKVGGPLAFQNLETSLG